MSLTECELRNERPERPGEFTFTWSVQNYSYCTKKETECLLSPDFVVAFLGKTKCYLVLYPRGDKQAPGFVSCKFRTYAKDSICNFTLAIRMSNGQFKESDENVYDGSEDFKNGIGYSKFVRFEELKGSDGYLYNDTFTVRCRMWKTSVDIPASVKWEAYSRIKVSKLDYTWILNDISVANGVFENEFNESVDITEFFTNYKEINLQLFEKGSQERNVKFWNPLLLLATSSSKHL
ncbi:hypothetical protein JTE90_008740 [Oedothorax gibbosus]|uniref:MATH domain-containing protein n=1 Tax=Oedothorax gibbosus TaxID=931172 RepID=A0AAV6UQQ0_9ARAC|nr:hypothetical protein JTE90_008740 [Oedothorax gibbosus]